MFHRVLLSALGAGVVVATAAGAAPGLTSVSAGSRALPTNEYGLPVLDEWGGRISYSRDQLAGLRALTPEGRPRPADGPSFDASAVGWYSAFGSGIGKSNIAVADNAGVKEVYLGGSTSTFGSDNYWQALVHDSSAGGYRQIFVSPYMAAGIARIEIGEVDPNPGREILVAREDGRVEIYAVAGKTWLREVVTAATGLKGLEVVDLGGGTTDEIVVCNGNNLYVYSGAGALLWQVPGVGGSDVVAGQMDADGGLEIAVTGGSVVDAATHAVQWTWPDGFGLHLETADIDGDGMEELIAADPWYFVWSYDVDVKLPKWSIPTPQDVGAIHVTDIDGDGVQELLVGDGQWGDIRAYDTVTQALEWSIDNPEHGVTDIAAADVDADGTTELLWGAGATSTGVDRLYIVDWTTEQFEWQNIHLDGPFVGPEQADLDGDGVPEIVVASFGSDSGYGSSRILVFDASFNLRAISAPIVGNLAVTGLHDLKLRDVDGDGSAEILVASDKLYDGVVEAYGFDAANAFTLKWTNATRPFGASFQSVEAADVDGDGALEIVAGAGREHTGALGVFIYVYDYATAAEEWHSLQMGGYWDKIRGLEVGNTDLDGSAEIVGMVYGGATYVFDGTSKQLQAILPGTGSALKLSGAAPSKILLGNASGGIEAYRYEQGSYPQIWQHDYGAGPVDGFELGSAALWLGSGGTLRRMTRPGATLWQSASYGMTFGARTIGQPSSGRFLSAGGYCVVDFSVD